MAHILTLLCGGMLVGVDPGSRAGPGAPTAQVWADYEARKAAAPAGADAQVRLALWCEEHGLTAQWHQHLAKAALIEPGNVLARGLMGFLEYRGRWLAPEKVAAALQSDDPRNAQRAEYNARRDRLDAQAVAVKDRLATMEGRVRPGELSAFRFERNRNLAMDRLKLGLWCEQAGLPTEARVEFTTAVQLDPRIDDAWKHLGYVRQDGRWMPADQAAAEAAEAKAQRDANIRWEPALHRWQLWLSDPKHSAEAEEQLDRVTDPRAVVAIKRVFLTRYEEGQVWALRILRRIATPASTAVVALLAVQSDHEAVRESATALLKSRPREDYLEPLVRKIHTPAQYAIEPVQGPGSTGTLVIDTPRYHLERSYNAPPPFTLGGNFYGYVGYDVNGLPVAIRGRELREARDPAKLAEFEERTLELFALANYNAIATQEQIHEDARWLERANARAREINARVGTILRDNFDAPQLGDDEVAWERWYYDRVGYSYTPAPRAYITGTAPGGFYAPSLISCFAAGTLVRTQDGLRPIEEIRPGEHVLTQQTTTGALAFQPVLVAHHNPPCQTVRLTLAGGEVLLPSIYHRFWIPGKGWVMARDLKPGDALRLLGGRATVTTIETADVVPVFNLTVAGNHSYFVGNQACLVHDNTLPGAGEPVFDTLTIAAARR
jgi:hypothetical protein